MKKMLGLLLATSIAFSSMGAFAAENDASFKDISDKKYDWARPYIVEMAKGGYIAGYEDNTYRPDNMVTKLETIVLFSRAMGAKKDDNAEIIEIALDKYSDIIEKANLNFGEDEVAYMLYRGALDEDDVNKYLAGGKASLAMSRQEASAIITKAMCADEAAKAELLVDMDYTDAKNISSEYSQYVFFVSENGIMNGMDDGSFMPEGNVLRSQIAAMLYRTVDKMELYIETVLVPEIETDVNNITLLDDENKEVKIGYKNTTKFYSNGEIIKDTEFVNSSRAMLTYIFNSLVFVDMYDRVVDETIRGIYQGASTQEGITTVTIKPSNSSKAVDYQAVGGVQVVDENGDSVSFNKISAGSYVEIELTNDKLLKLNVLKKDSFIKDATVANIEIEDDLYLTISHEDEEYDGMVFVLSDDVVVYKNNDVEDLSKIYKGDRIDITMEYGNVTKLKAYSNTKTYQGTISEISISTEPVIKIKSGEDILEFVAATDVKVKVNGQDATLYDLRVGDSIKLSAESDTILSIETTSASITGNKISGIVDVVNASKGFIKVNGETVFCKDATTTFITAAGETKVMKNLKAGDTVSIRGVMQNGAYMATLIIIE
ncbi:MAG: S-layer homology domain-containing protein [Clostridia bacterium]|nr:S-layer homology domain-containing protein [Clostridia bacterium]